MVSELKEHVARILVGLALGLAIGMIGMAILPSPILQGYAVAASPSRSCFLILVVFLMAVAAEGIMGSRMCGVVDGLGLAFIISHYIVQASTGLIVGIMPLFIVLGHAGRIVYELDLGQVVALYLMLKHVALLRRSS